MHLLSKTLKLAGAGVAAALLLLAIVVSIPLEATVPPLEPRADTRYWEMDGGYRIAYTRVEATGETGKAGKPPIVFLHGGPGGYVPTSAIETIGRLAASGHDVYLYDQIGSGLSDRLARPKDYTFLGHVGDLHEIVTEKIGAGPAVLIGQSYGGQLVSYFLAHHRELVERAVLTSPGGIEPPLFDDEGNWIAERLYPQPDSLRFLDPPDVSDEMRVSAWPLRVIATVALATAFNVKLMPDAEADAALNTIVTKIKPGLVCDRTNVPDESVGGMGMYAHGWSNWFGGVDDWRDELRQVEVPLLVLQGQCDMFPYAAVFEHAALVPNGRYRLIEGAGHVIWWERPDELVEEIRLFLSERDSGRT